jgi:hypothetical protein
MDILGENQLSAHHKACRWLLETEEGQRNEIPPSSLQEGYNPADTVVLPQ